MMIEAQTFHIPDFDSLDRDLLEHVGDVKIDKVPVIDSVIVVNDFYRPKDKCLELLLKTNGQDQVEISRADEEPLMIDFLVEHKPYKLVTVHRVLAKAAGSLVFNRVPYSRDWTLENGQNIRYEEGYQGLQTFATLVSNKAIDQQIELVGRVYQNGESF